MFDFFKQFFVGAVASLAGVIGLTLLFAVTMILSKYTAAATGTSPQMALYVWGLVICGGLANAFYFRRDYDFRRTDK